MKLKIIQERKYRIEILWNEAEVHKFHLIVISHLARTNSHNKIKSKTSTYLIYWKQKQKYMVYLYREHRKKKSLHENNNKNNKKKKPNEILSIWKRETTNWMHEMIFSIFFFLFI